MASWLLLFFLLFFPPWCDIDGWLGVKYLEWHWRVTVVLISAALRVSTGKRNHPPYISTSCRLYYGRTSVVQFGIHAASFCVNSTRYIPHVFVSAFNQIKIVSCPLCRRVLCQTRSSGLRHPSRGRCRKAVLGVCVCDGRAHIGGCLRAPVIGSCIWTFGNCTFCKYLT